MSLCHGCGGVVGRDCFNPQECEWISRDMQARAAAEEYTAPLVARIAELEQKLSARTEVAPIDKLAALMVGADVDVDICPPGNHGGRGADADRWLVTLMPPDHNQIREFFGDTLAEAIRQATL